MKFFSYTIPMKKWMNVLLIKIAFFVFLLPFFEAFGENKWCLQIRYFKRETYALQNAVFGSLFVSQEIFEQKASKTRFFYFHHFWNFIKFSIQNYKFLFPIQFQWKIDWMCYWSRLHFLRFCCPFLRHFLGISVAFKLHNLREKLILYKTQFLEAYL